MPTIAIVDGIRVVLYMNDHEPPHFHAYLAEHTLRIEIMTGRALNEGAPASMQRKLASWTRENRQALLQAWEDVRNERTPRRIG